MRILLPSLLILALLVAACGSSGSGAAPASDAPSADASATDGTAGTLPDGAPASDSLSDGTQPGREGSRYELTLSLPANRTLKLESLLDDVPNAIIFGSTHIAPAVSLAVRDTRYDPAYAVITLDFGIVSGSDQHPVQTSGKGEYRFGLSPPLLEVNIEGIPYASATQGAEGRFEITDFSTTMGGLFAGTLSGTLVQVTTKEKRGEIDVEGSFRMILPEP